MEGLKEKILLGLTLVTLATSCSNERVDKYTKNYCDEVNTVLGKGYPIYMNENGWIKTSTDKFVQYKSDCQECADAGFTMDCTAR